MRVHAHNAAFRLLPPQQQLKLQVYRLNTRTGSVQAFLPRCSHLEVPCKWQEARKLPFRSREPDSWLQRRRAASNAITGEGWQTASRVPFALHARIGSSSCTTPSFRRRPDSQSCAREALLSGALQHGPPCPRTW